MTPAGEPVSPGIDPGEREKFRALATRWWDPEGPFKPLHQLNAARIPIIVDMIRARWPAGSGARPLEGIRILDAGCGGGLAAEPLARAGASVVGIDVVADSLTAARLHAETAGLPIDYRLETAEDHARTGARHDVVLALEVVEHIADLEGFLTALATLVKPGGILIIATLNRTLKSLLCAIIGAEYVLRLLPRGTHDWRKFPRPGEIHGMLAGNGLVTERVLGLRYNPLAGKVWKQSSDTAVNYMLRANRPLPPPAKTAEPT